ncbi:GIY-YIG nuclease family protein [Streptomyces sp. MUSC 14]|uniref:GIY-YIG nuclease family protein n=1 Tax=Streptomyces sp. MUSC 14 TaxID=1354889 RepID=UPI00210EC56E|nr:GIY-YIG nuclease family protein [Streptomyces sp. MUSC 14]
MLHSHLVDEHTALYRLYDGDGSLLYIGITHDPEARWVSHAATKPWWPAVETKSLEWHDTRGAAEAAEARAIATEPTPFNRAGSPWAPGPPQLGEDEVAVADAKKNLSELLTSVRLLRRAYFLTSRGKRQAALVPVELGELVQQAGGPDKAAAILASHVGSQIAHLKAQPGVREDS